LRWELILFFETIMTVQKRKRLFLKQVLILVTVGLVSMGTVIHAFALESHDHSVPAEASKPDAMDMASGKAIYSMSCIYCHGAGGKGDGAASIFIGPYSHPRPNDFTAGRFKFRSTESGSLPMLTDLMRTIREGIPGFMPSFQNLGNEAIGQVAHYIQTAFIKKELPTKTTIQYVEHAGPYIYSVESVKRGALLYKEMACDSCHGAEGAGGFEMLYDDRGLVIMPMDLGRPEGFGNGIAHEDIYRTIMTGLDGTPMPSYSDAFLGREQSAWDLVHFVLSLQER
jgi:mono/diheme cytochrome c family protein